MVNRANDDATDHPRIALWWLRRDLRLDDNPALAFAVEHADIVIPVYIHAPDEEAPWQPGAASNWWLYHSLTQLGERLDRLGSPLVVRRGASLDELQQLIATTGARMVLWNRLYEPAIIARDRIVKQTLRHSGIEARSFNAALLAEPWTVATRQGAPYKVFSPFWRTAHAQGFDTTPCPTPERLQAPATAPESLPLAALPLRPKRDWADSWPQHWTPGEHGAQACWQAFVEHPIRAYHSGRERPDRRGSSRLSPHLHFGEIGPRQILHDIRRRGFADNNIDVENYVRELGWREFAHHVLFHFPRTPEEPLNPAFARFPWRDDPDQRLLAAWRRGRTGMPIVDAAMRELWSSGWMHNRSRMIVGSYLTKNLRLPWQAGARWFWDTLVDADLAANTLGWQWASGSGADAAPYFRIFNPILQGERFDPEGDYVGNHVPELRSIAGKRRHNPDNLSPVVRSGHYPQPIVDLKGSRAEALEAFEAIKSS